MNDSAATDTDTKQGTVHIEVDPQQLYKRLMELGKLPRTHTIKTTKVTEYAGRTGKSTSTSKHALIRLIVGNVSIITDFDQLKAVAECSPTRTITIDVIHEESLKIHAGSFKYTASHVSGEPTEELVLEIPQSHLDALADLQERGWEITWNGEMIKLALGHKAIEASGRFRIVNVPGTPLSQSFKTAEEGIEAIHTFAYFVESKLDIAQRWLAAINKIIDAKWTVDIINDEKALHLIETVAGRMS